MAFLNPNIRKLKPSATLLINQKIKEWRNKGRTIYHFGFGQSPFPVPNAVVEALKEHATANSYLPTEGLPALRTAIASFLRTHQAVDANEQSVFIGPGSKELLYQSILLMDATYLIPKGSWVSYVPQTTLASKPHVVMQTKIEHNFKLQPEVLDDTCKKIGEGSKVLIINSPNNPTGAVYSLAELEQLAGVCRSHNVIVFSDEIYSQLTFSAAHATSFASVYPENTLVFGGLSKVFSAGGYRLGFVHLPPALNFLTESYSALFSETFSAVSAPIQYAAIPAFHFSKEVEDHVANSKVILHALGGFVYENLKTAGVRCTLPEGGFYIMVDFGRFNDTIKSLGVKNSTELAHLILDDYDVALLPGTDFCFEPREWVFRLAYVDFDGKKAMNAYQKNKNMPLDLKFIKTFAPNVYNGVQKLIDLTDWLREHKTV
ncbi:MAG: aminotransferase class I/II-fold pyridoxal phosphate-dependent enzyme [Deltaproteobacteria bacterium]|nr:aminotransferase class I/II-fold pyridoxal phosphate-dependent enzyme [Deltaproteobacteria bacterium]